MFLYTRYKMAYAEHDYRNQQRRLEQLCLAVAHAAKKSKGDNSTCTVVFRAAKAFYNNNAPSRSGDNGCMPSKSAVSSEWIRRMNSQNIDFKGDDKNVSNILQLGIPDEWLDDETRAYLADDENEQGEEEE